VGYPYVGPVAHDSGNGNLPINRIVVHCTAGADAKGARGTARYFQMESATGSAHAITDPNELVISAYDNVVCWHAPPNPHTLGIEICCSQDNQGKGHWDLPSHQAMLKRAAKWVAEKAKLYNVPIVRLNPDALKDGKRGICGHVDVSLAFHQSTHEDPGPYFPWATFMALVQAEFDNLNTTEDELSAQDVTNLKTYVTDELERFFGFLEKPNGNIDQQLRATEAVVKTMLDSAEADIKKMVADAAEGVRAYTEAATISLKDYVRQTDNEADILSAVATVAMDLRDLTAKVEALPKA
jgi:hypothetical protein